MDQLLTRGPQPTLHTGTIRRAVTPERLETPNDRHTTANTT